MLCVISSTKKKKNLGDRKMWPSEKETNKKNTQKQNHRYVHVNWKDIKLTMINMFNKIEGKDGEKISEKNFRRETDYKNIKWIF